MLRQKTLLGETYVELTPGTPSADSVAENGTLAQAQVAPTVELDEILRAFDPKTRRAWQTWMQAQAQGIDGYGRDINDALGNLGPFAEDTATLVDILNRQKGAVTRLISNTGVVFDALTERQPVKYGALVALGDPIVLSRSPELFFEIGADGTIETHPMKGTAPRGVTKAEDARLKSFLRNDEKNQAENRMIVDLLRNDISLISEVGTLEVPELFRIETYPTVHQMVSRVRAKLLPDVGIRQVLAALFPCGSITGAPKIRAMEILHELEATPRDVYCGAIGWIAPGGTMRFSVAIRTISLFVNGEAVYNVGGGVVFDSTAEEEYRECLLKARFATGTAPISN